MTTSAAGTRSPAKRKTSGNVSGVFLNLYVAVASIGSLYPIVWLIYSSLKTQKEFDVNSVALPKQPTLQNYMSLMSKPLW